MNLQKIQAHPTVGLLRKFLTVVGAALVVYLIYLNWSILVVATSEPLTTLALAFGLGCLSLLIQAAGFRTFPGIARIPAIVVSDIWCSAIIFNHIFPLAGGLGYRFVALKIKGVELRETGRATVWFLGSSTYTSVAALVVIYLLSQASPYLAVLTAALLVGLVPILYRQFLSDQPPFIFIMIGYQVAQIFVMGLVVIYGANLVGLDLSLTQGAVLGCVMRLGSLISLTPAGLGIQEVIIIGVLAAYGVTSSDSSSTAVMVRIVYLVSAVLVTLGSRALLLIDWSQEAEHHDDNSRHS